MSIVLLAVRELAAQYGRREVFTGVSFEVRAGQSLGVIGDNGAGKTTLLRTVVGCLTPTAGSVRIGGLAPRDAVARTPVAYFAGEATLPGSVSASAWSGLGAAEPLTTERRAIRTLSSGSRQLVGLRTVLGRHPLHLIVLDEPWEALDADGARWLNAILETKRDRGAAVVLSSHRLTDLAGLCDLYLFLLPHEPTLLKAHEIAAVGPVTAALLADTFERLRAGRLPSRRGAAEGAYSQDWQTIVGSETDVPPTTRRSPASAACRGWHPRCQLTRALARRFTLSVRSFTCRATRGQIGVPA